MCFEGTDACSSITCDVNANCVAGKCECLVGFIGDGAVCVRKSIFMP